MTLFESFLKQHDQAAWARTIAALLFDIHEVDRAPTQVWFHFFPLALSDAFAGSDDSAQIARTLRLDGMYRLGDQVDTSHWFLYGHRYWPQVKAAIVKRAEAGTAPPSLELGAVVRHIAADAGVDVSLALGITAVGLMTLQQVGLAALRAGRAHPASGADVLRKTPAQILADRRKTDGQGLAGLWRGIRARYTVTFDERRPDARFPIIHQQHLTTASANDTRRHPPGPRTCLEGPIPVECRTASCGTCWVGVLGGAERLSDVDAHEARRMKEFGYTVTTDPKPLIRLACAALASGNVAIVIPPWNGFIGRCLESREASAPGRK